MPPMPPGLCPASVFSGGPLLALALRSASYRALWPSVDPGTRVLRAPQGPVKTLKPVLMFCCLSGIHRVSHIWWWVMQRQ